MFACGNGGLVIRANFFTSMSELIDLRKHTICRAEEFSFILGLHRD
jgi:hypothetical protein